MLQHIFLAVFNASLSMSWLIVLLLLFTHFLNKRYTPRLRVALCALIAVRLVLPVSVTLPRRAIELAVPQQLVAPLDHAALQGFAPGTALPPASPAGTTGSLTAISPMQLIALVWLAGAVLLLIYSLLAGLLYVKRLQRFSSPAPQKVQEACAQTIMQLGIRHAPRLCCTAIVSAPMLAGFLRPTLYLPQTLYTDEQLKLVLRHELTHYRRKDLWLKLVCVVARAMHWFNPLVWLLVHQVNVDIELACDASIVASLDHEQRAAYGKLILSGIMKRREQPMWLSTSLGSPKKQTEKRLKNLFDLRPKHRGLLVGLAGLALVLCGGSLVACSLQKPVSAPGGTPGSSITGDSIPARSQRMKAEMDALSAAFSGEISIDQVTVEIYDQDPQYPYIKELFTNHTDQTITGWSMGMLAFDAQGNPLKVDWYASDSSSERSYYNLCEIEPGISESYRVAPGETFNVRGGWSIFNEVDQNNTCAVAYALYCFKEVTFDDGTIWQNPQFESWYQTYHGQTVAPEQLAGYYPAAQALSA